MILILISETDHSLERDINISADLCADHHSLRTKLGFPDNTHTIADVFRESASNGYQKCIVD